MRYTFRCLSVLLICLLVPGALQAQQSHETMPSATTSTFNTNLQNYLLRESGDRLKDMLGLGWVVVGGGGVHATSVSMVSAAFSTLAYSSNGHYISQAAAAIDYAAVGCSTTDSAWVIINEATTGALSNNFTRVTGTRYAVNCTDTARPTLPAGSAWLMHSIITASAITQVEDIRQQWWTPEGDLPTNRHGTTTPIAEVQRISGDLVNPFVVSGCVPAVRVASLTLATFACQGYVRLTSGALLYVDQATSVVGPVDSADGTDWLALHRDTTTVVSGWTRQPGTHYLWQRLAIRPADPDNGLVIARVTVAGAVITAVVPVANVDPVLTSGVFDVTRYGADATGSRDSGAAITSACGALQAHGGGTLLFPPGTYAVYTIGEVYTGLCALTGLTGVRLEGTGATLAIDSTRVFSTSFGVAFSFDTVTNLAIDGFTVTGPTLPVQDTAVIGVELFTCISCTMVSATNNRVHGVISAFKFDGTVGGLGVSRSKQITISNLWVEGSFYGYLAQYCCEDVDLDIRASNIHRSVFTFGGVFRNKIRVYSENPTSTDVFLETAGGAGVHDVELWYSNVLTDNPYMNAPHICLCFADATASFIINVTIHLRKDYTTPTGANFNGGSALWVTKFENFNATPDATDRGHQLQNLKVTGRITGTSTTPADGPISTNEANGARFGLGDFWYNIIFENLYIDLATGQGFVFSIGSLVDQITLINVTAPGAGLRNATNSFLSPGKVRVINSSLCNEWQTCSTLLSLSNILYPGAGTMSLGWTGKTLLNGAAGNITWLLPQANPGLQYTFLRDGANLVFIDPNGSELVRGCSAGKYYRLTTQGDSVTLYSQTVGVWEILAAQPLGTCEP